jgi:Protein of unknown function (DUF1593)
MPASLISLAVSVMLAGSVSAAPSHTDAGASDSHDAVRPRVFVLTDIGLDPDDSESLVRFLLYSNEFDVEGMAAVTSTWLRDKVHPELIEERYVKLDSQDGLYTDAADRVMSGDRLYVSNQATLWRWRDAFQNDFAARIQWTTSGATWL